MTKKCKVLICDDHDEFRGLVRAVLKRDPRVEVVGEAADGKEVVDKALRLRPHVVLMDLNMPQLTGLEATRRIRRSSRRIRILMVSAFRGEDVVSPCLDAGASGYFEKYRPLAELSEAIETVWKGGRYLSPGVLDKVLRAHDSVLF